MDATEVTQIEKVKKATLEDANNVLIKLSSQDIDLKALIESEENLDGFKDLVEKSV